MVPHIPAPIQGQPLKSSWGAAVAESCNAMRQIGARGLVRDGAGGFGMEQLPANLRERRVNHLLHPYTADALKPDPSPMGPLDRF